MAAGLKVRVLTHCFTVGFVMTSWSISLNYTASWLFLHIAFQTRPRCSIRSRSPRSPAWGVRRLPDDERKVYKRSPGVCPVWPGGSGTVRDLLWTRSPPGPLVVRFRLGRMATCRLPWSLLFDPPDTSLSFSVSLHHRALCIRPGSGSRARSPVFRVDSGASWCSWFGMLLIGLPASVVVSIAACLAGRAAASRTRLLCRTTVCDRMWVWHCELKGETCVHNVMDYTIMFNEYKFVEPRFWSLAFVADHISSKCLIFGLQNLNPEFDVEKGLKFS